MNVVTGALGRRRNHAVLDGGERLLTLTPPWRKSPKCFGAVEAYGVPIDVAMSSSTPSFTPTLGTTTWLLWANAAKWR